MCTRSWSTPYISGIVSRSYIPNTAQECACSCGRSLCRRYHAHTLRRGFERPLPLRLALLPSKRCTRPVAHQGLGTEHLRRVDGLRRNRGVLPRVQGPKPVTIQSLPQQSNEARELVRRAWLGELEICPSALKTCGCARLANKTVTRRMPASGKRKHLRNLARW
jgi:hypothetical protein